MRTLIVWGCSSGAGKSLVTTALCRLLANRGLSVAPFKAQNMSNNARVVPGLAGRYGEIGSAQYFQALAARVQPQVDHNPVLLKPEGETRSQVLLHGDVDAELGRMPWRQRSDRLAQAARASFERLAPAHDIVVVEGAGSPAEINLAANDYVNLGVARWAQALGTTQALLVSDIDRGGAFAHAYGTWALLPPDLQPLLKGFLFNKFRGDAALLAPGPADLQALTGVPTVGVLPMLRGHGLPEEDGVHAIPPARPGAAVRVAVLAPPAISNLDEFQALHQLPGVQLVWAREVRDLMGADWVILPGSKQVSGDLAWLRARGFEPALRAHAAAGRRLLGICGGLQMLGETLHDPDGVDGPASDRNDGLALLPLHTRYAAPKRVLPDAVRFGGLAAPWGELEGVRCPGYEIRMGYTEAAASSSAVLWSVDGQAIGWQRGSVLGVYAHGLLESPAVLNALFGVSVPDIDVALDALAAHLDAALSPTFLRNAGR